MTTIAPSLSGLVLAWFLRSNIGTRKSAVTTAQVADALAVSRKKVASAIYNFNRRAQVYERVEEKGAEPRWWAKGSVVPPGYDVEAEDRRLVAYLESLGTSADDSTGSLMWEDYEPEIAVIAAMREMSLASGQWLFEPGAIIRQLQVHGVVLEEPIAKVLYSLMALEWVSPQGVGPQWKLEVDDPLDVLTAKLKESADEVLRASFEEKFELPPPAPVKEGTLLSYPLRPSVEVGFVGLPADLTFQEGLRLAIFILSRVTSP